MVHLIRMHSLEVSYYKTLVFVAYRIDCTENTEYFENKDLLFTDKDIVLVPSEAYPLKNFFDFFYVFQEKSLKKKSSFMNYCPKSNYLIILLINYMIGSHLVLLTILLIINILFETPTLKFLLHVFLAGLVYFFYVMEYTLMRFFLDFLTLIPKAKL